MSVPRRMTLFGSGPMYPGKLNRPISGCFSSALTSPSCFFARNVSIRCWRCDGLDHLSMLMRIVWLAPVAMLLILSAHPLMTTLSVALGATDCCAPAGALTTAAVKATATRQVSIVLFILMLLSREGETQLAGHRRARSKPRLSTAIYTLRGIAAGR